MALPSLEFITARIARLDDFCISSPLGFAIGKVTLHYAWRATYCFHCQGSLMQLFKLQTRHIAACCLLTTVPLRIAAPTTPGNKSEQTQPR